MNFLSELDKALSGGNKGIYMGDGLYNVSKAINGLQKGRIYGIAAAPKVGKSTFSDYAFVLQPYLWYLKEKQQDPTLELEFIYLSFEIDRVSKELEFTAFFLHNLYGIDEIKLEDGQTVYGKDRIPLSPDYLRGRIQDDDSKTIIPKPRVVDAMKEIYQNHIIPLFGEYDDSGNLVTDNRNVSKPGLIKFVEQKENPTGLYKKFKRHASRHGTFVYDNPENPQYRKIIGYKPVNPNKYTIVVTDHMRKIPVERGWNLKQTVDKYLEYTVDLRNWCDWTFIHIVHLNRSMADVQRMKQFGDQLYPTSDDIKDTGNLSEDADYLFTLFNPNDTRYNLQKHFGLDLRDRYQNEIYPNLRTLHLVESRHCSYPQHFRFTMNGGTKSFKQLEI